MKIPRLLFAHRRDHFFSPPLRGGVPRQSRGLMEIGLAALAISALISAAAWATPPSAIAPADTGSEATTEPSGVSSTTKFSEASFIFGLSRSQYMLGDMGGLRPFLAKYGVSLNFSETSEGLGNATGGNTRGFEYDGLTQMVLQVDTQRAFGLHGGTFDVSGLQIHGRNLSADNLQALQTVSGIESDRATRLWELWYQQKFLDEDRMDIKVGQQSLDQEFMVSQNALLFVNTMFGWPMLPSADLPGGGPAYPLSALGVRVRGHPTDAITVLGGVYNGSPVSNNEGDPQQQNRSGTSFPLNGGALVIAEVQYAYPSLGTMVYADDAQPLSGTYRFGMWYDSESFDDERLDNHGVPLASSASTGIPRSHHGDYGIYGVIDQMLWHSEEDPDHALSFSCVRWARRRGIVIWLTSV